MSYKDQMLSYGPVIWEMCCTALQIAHFIILDCSGLLLKLQFII